MGDADAHIVAKKRRARRIIRQVDHILIRSSDPEALFFFLTESLHLPVAWPIASYGHFTSGGVGIGDVNVEVIQSHPSPGAAPAEGSHASFSGIAFEPYPLADSLTELAAREIVHAAPAPYVASLPDGSQATCWTTVDLPQFSNHHQGIFLCEYSPSFLNVASNRERLKAELLSKQNGALGILAVQEITLGARNLADQTRRWQNLLRPIQPTAKEVWQVGNGPALRFVAAPEDQIQGLVLTTVSLKRAKAFLEEHGMLGTVTDNEIVIDPSNIQGLQMRLADRA